MSPVNMYLMLLMLLISASALQAQSTDPEEVAKSAEEAFQKTIGALKNGLEEFDKKVEEAHKKTSEAISKIVKAPFDAAYDTIAQAGGKGDDPCVQAQKKEADSKIDELISDGTKCIFNIITDITGNVEDIVSAIDATEKAAAAVVTSIKSCKDESPPDVAPCVAKGSADASEEAIEKDAKAVEALTKLATIEARIPTLLLKCEGEAISPAAVAAGKILLELSKCA